MVNNKRSNEARRVTWLGLLINITLTIFKLIAGVLGKSAAMIADAFHSLSDFATDIVVLLGFKFIGKPIDKSHDYGHGKVETLSAVIIGVTLFAVGLRILWGGADELFKSHRGEIIPEPRWIAFYAAIVSIITKEWLYRYTIRTGRAINSQAVIANAWHHRSDAFSSIGAMMGIGGAIILGEKWHTLDPIAAVVVSFFIIRAAINISRQGFSELLEASLSEEMENKILAIARKTPGVIQPHDLKTRRIGNYIAVDLHIEVDKTLGITAAHLIATNVENKIKATFGEETFILVHTEPAEQRKNLL